MKHLIVLFVLASIAIVGCTDNSSQEPVSTQLVDMPLPLNKPTPFKMTFVVRGSLNFAGRCAPAPTLELTGTGNATQLGRFSIVESNCMNTPNPDGTIDFYNGEATETAANGDIIYASYSGTLTPLGGPIYRIDAVSIITGGTGRFANARGEQVATGITDFTPGALSTLSLDGWIERR
jgi:hypothetical protein